MEKSYMNRAVKESLQQTMQKKGPHHGPKTEGNPSGNSRIPYPPMVVMVLFTRDISMQII